MSKRVQSHEHPSIVELLGDKIYLRKNIVLVPATEDREEYYEYDENIAYSPTRDIEYIEEHFDFYWDKAEFEVSQAFAQSEQDWVKSELIRADIEIAKIDEASKHAIGTRAAWINRKEDLRDYVRNNDGILTVIGERP